MGDCCKITKQQDRTIEKLCCSPPEMTVGCREKKNNTPHRELPPNMKLFVVAAAVACAVIALARGESIVAPLSFDEVWDQYQQG